VETSKWDAKGTTTETDDERLSITQYSYQHPTYPGMLYREINYDGSYTEYDYDDAGNIVTVVDANGIITTNMYDNLNRLISTTEAGIVGIDRGYDAHGNLSLLIDPEGSQTAFTYDDMGRVVSTISSDSGSTLTSYDEAGNRISKTDGNSITVQYQHDDLGRLENITFPDPAQNILFTYDQGVNAKGKRTGMTDPSGSTTWAYDDQGRAISKTTIVNGVAYTISRTFTAGGSTNSFTYPDGRIVNFARDGQNKITQIATTQSSATKVLLNNLQYQPFGGVSSMTNGAGVTVESQQSECGCGVGTVSLGNPLERQYSYDSNKNIIGIDYTNYPGMSVSYDYDDQDRLVEYDGPQGRVLYSYDLIGNRLSRETKRNDKNQEVEPKLETYTYTAASNKIANIKTDPGATTVTYGYDGAGNIISMGKTLVYNQNNRLYQVKQDTTVLGQYVYNGMEQRVQKTAGSVTTVFLYDFDGNLIAEAMPDGTITREYIYSGSSRLAMVDVATGIVLHYVNDKLGTPQSLVDENNTPVWSAKYVPFGDAAIDANPIVEQNFRFPGQYYDSETGLHYNWHRYYDPGTGRYLRPDPIGFEGGINLYLYANANPVNLIDPTGLVCGSWWNDWLVPDEPFGFDFSDACSFHDDCYNRCGEDKGSCDRAFRRLMLRECRSKYVGYQRSRCESAARSYYNAVRNLGQSSYDYGQSNCECNQ
jgi:RHS repeat-associated protein